MSNRSNASGTFGTGPGINAQVIKYGEIEIKFGWYCKFTLPRIDSGIYWRCWNLFKPRNKLTKMSDSYFTTISLEKWAFATFGSIQNSIFSIIHSLRLLCFDYYFSNWKRISEFTILFTWLSRLFCILPIVITTLPRNLVAWLNGTNSDSVTLVWRTPLGNFLIVFLLLYYRRANVFSFGALASPHSFQRSGTASVVLARLTPRSFSTDIFSTFGVSTRRRYSNMCIR